MVTPLTANGRISSASFGVGRIAIAVLTLGLAAGVADAAPPKIRTDAGNTVPRCATPKRLMAFIKTRNSNLDPRFADIAAAYKHHGDIWRVRWDYAFFQMAVETNFLTYRTGNGRWGDVNPKQNNFAGLGTTGGGVPGDSYPDVNTGVLAQIQHLVVYSGERIDEPVGARTRLKQDDILVTMASKKGRTTFADLARRWAADKHYGASIEWVANNFRQQFCNGADRAEDAEPSPASPVKRVAVVKKLTPVANLGGPTEADGDQAAATKSPPVRTIWSAADAPPPVAETSGDVASEPETFAASSSAAAAIPERKPQTPAVVVAEQIIQTGEEPPAATAPTAPETASAAQTATIATEAPRAFAFAAGMSSTRPREAVPKVAASGDCPVTTASYGGKKILLVRSAADADLRFTVLTVLEGFEKSMLDSYLKAHAPGGSSVGEFANKNAAFAKARELCPRATVPTGEGANAG
ncbi:MAG: glucosaminidase domain-containing protein [Hyphomicrobium sp.]|nr:glucosaminidase domain-containing protein [Hyphomicrobium sp.]